MDIDCTVSLFEIITMPYHKALADNLTLFLISDYTELLFPILQISEVLNPMSFELKLLQKRFDTSFKESYTSMNPWKWMDNLPHCIAVCSIHQPSAGFSSAQLGLIRRLKLQVVSSVAPI